MDDSEVCTPLLAESDAQKNTSNAPYEGSVTDADKVLITNTDSTKVEGVKRGEDLLKDLLADDYCHVCEAVLLFESQRLSHYEGKKHAQRVRVYLQAKRAGKTEKEDAAAQRSMTMDRDHFCKLCNMVFSSHVVATSHYEGKVHAKNMRKQGLETSDRRSETLPAEDTLSKSAQDGGAVLPDPAVSTSSTNTEVDLKDPNKYCSLCAASFNNPHTALQHYNGRKHQRSLSRQELLKGVEDHIKQAGLMCQICSVQLNSVEMYQAHMQGSKHLSRQKKVIDLCKTQQKVYETFADELSDYIQIQKARGINPRPPALPPKDAQQEEEEEERVAEDVDSRADNVDVTNFVANVSRKCNSPHLSFTGCYSPAEQCPPTHLDPSGSFYRLDYSAGPPLPFMRRKNRKPSSSSASSSSSYSSCTSDSEDTKYRSKKRRERTKRPKREEPERERGRKWFGREKQDSEESGRRTRKNHGRQEGQDRNCQVEDAEPVPKERVMDSLGEMDESSRHKNRKEKKRVRGRVDTRTEEERLWDVSILGF